MAGETDFRNELLEIARQGNGQRLYVYILIHNGFPASLDPIESALRDLLLSFDARIWDEPERATVLIALVETMFPGFEDRRRGYFDFEEDFYWHMIAHDWYDLFTGTLNSVRQIEHHERRLEALLALTRSFRMWFQLLSLEGEVSYYERGRWREEYQVIIELIRQIGRIEDGYWRAKGLEALSLLFEAVLTARYPGEVLWNLRYAMDELEGIGDDETKVEQLRFLVDRLSRLRPPPPSKGVPLPTKEAPPLEPWEPPPVPLGPPPEPEPPPEELWVPLGPPPPEEDLWAPALEAPPTLEPPLRYADFTFFHAEEDQLNEQVPDGHVLQVEKWYQLEVAVRIEPIGIPVEDLERLPIREPKQKEDVMIMVTAEGDGFEIAEPVQTLILPPLGDSQENAWFRVRPLRQSVNGNDLAEIRIRLYYNLNLIEVAVVKVEVVGKFDSATQSQWGLEKPISFEQERLERDYTDFDNVKPRKMQIDITKRGDHFLFNFAFQKDKKQKIIFTAPVRLLATDLEDDLINIRKTWYDIALSKTFSKGLQGDADEFLENVRKLAWAGRRLWRKLFKRERKSSMFKIGTWLERHPLERDGIIQITLSKEAANFVFPWALIYDRAVPKEKYKLPDLDGFWGVRCNIEQHVPEIVKGTDEAIHVDDALMLGFMLWRQFRNAKEEILLMETFMKQSVHKLKVTIPPITDADTCYAILDDCNAQILYFYCHGYTRHRLADIGVGPNLEIFLRRYEGLEQDSPLRETYQLLYESIKQEGFEPDRSWIELSYGKLYLDDLYDYVEDLCSNPLVILNMCESAQVTPSLSDSFIHFFLDRGATGVIGTECPMTVEFAHPFAEKLLHDVLAGEEVGIALLNARRHFLECKNPLGLAYSLFGLATTRFEPPRL